METKPIIAPNLTVIPMGYLSIESNAYKSLVTHCKTHKLEVKNLYLYVDNEGDIIAGFSPDESLHVKLHHIHWKPVFKC